MTMYSRAKRLLSIRETFGQSPINIGDFHFLNNQAPETQMILRMMVRNPNTNGFKIPEELMWLKDTILYCDSLQKKNKLDHPFVYITVRNGFVSTKTDDLWHVDGFSMRIPHPPEQNYIWANCFGTEVLHQKMKLPLDFDPMKHNLHMYFQHEAKKSLIRELNSGFLYGIDPYVIHRRPSISAGLNRKFFRISFVPIEIEDDTCMVNPLIGREKDYNRPDIRQRLISYHGN